MDVLGLSEKDSGGTPPAMTMGCVELERKGHRRRAGEVDKWAK